MPRQSRKHKQIRFDLYLDNDAEDNLRRFLVKMAVRGQMREWIIQALLKALEQEAKA